MRGPSGEAGICGDSFTPTRANAVDKYCTCLCIPPRTYQTSPALPRVPANPRPPPMPHLLLALSVIAATFTFAACNGVGVYLL